MWLAAGIKSPGDEEAAYLSKLGWREGARGGGRWKVAAILTGSGLDRRYSNGSRASRALRQQNRVSRNPREHGIASVFRLKVRSDKRKACRQGEAKRMLFWWGWGMSLVKLLLFWLIGASHL